MKTASTTIVSLIGAGSLVLLGACSTAPTYNDRVYSTPVQQAPISSEYGQVQGIDVIPVATRSTGTGALIGAVLGGVLGNQFGHGGGRALATIGGAVGGGVAGNAIEERRKRDDEVFRVTVRFDNGAFRDFDFRDVGALRVGDRVKLEAGQIYRL